MVKEKVQDLMMGHDRDEEIYSNGDTLDFAGAVIHFFGEKGVDLSPDDLTYETSELFVDSDAQVGLNAVVTILSLELDIHMVAYRRTKWDYYINEVKKSEFKIVAGSYDVILLQNELESGLNLASTKHLVTLMEKDAEYIPFSTEENNSSAHGFIKASTLEENDWDASEIDEYVRKIIGDMDNENQDGVYEMDNGIRLYIGYSLNQKYK